MIRLVNAALLYATLVVTSCYDLPVLDPKCGLKVPGPATSRARQFLVAFPDLSQQQSGNTTYYVQYGTDLDSTISVSVLSPQQGLSVLNQSSVRRGLLQTVNVQADLKLTGSTILAQKSILVTASGNISVIASSQRGTDRYAYSAVPFDSLDTTYFVVANAPLLPQNNWHGIIVITAAEAGWTDIQISFPKPKNDGSQKLIVQYGLTQYTNNDVLQRITLNQYDSVQIQAIQGDITGTQIVATKKVAVISGNDDISLGPRLGVVGSPSNSDSAFEQLPPLNTWGQEYLTVIPPPLGLNGASQFQMNMRLKVIAGWMNTMVTVEDRSYMLNNIGDSVEVAIQQLSTGRAVYVYGNKPILVAQTIDSYSNIQTRRKRWTVNSPKPSMVLLPAVENWAVFYTFDAPRFDYRNDWPYSYLLVVMISSVQRWGVVLDDNFVATKFVWFDAQNPLYSVGYYDNLPIGYHVLRHNNGAPLGAWLLAAQEGSRASYGTALGMNLAKKTCQTCPNSGCDLKDNDCDYAIDEEICDNIDNDHDGLIDEDCCGLFPIYWTVSPSVAPTAQNLFVGLMSAGGAVLLAILVALGAIYGTGSLGTDT